MIDSPNALANHITLAEAARLLPGCISPTTVWRWTRRGIVGIKLKSKSIGARTFVTKDDLEEFVRQVTAARAAKANDSLPDRTPETEAELKAAGLTEPRRRGRPRKQQAAEAAR
jgi:hypothetical protein